MTENKIAFFSRDAIVHELGGSTTAALNLLAVLKDHGAQITVTITSAHSRSPRLFFRQKMALPDGVTLTAPGFMRVGPWFFNPLSPLAWLRIFCRGARRFPLLRPVERKLVALLDGRLVADAWDLTPPTEAELALATRQARALNAPTIVVNYAFWGPLFATAGMAGRKGVVLGHDLLSARIAKFIKSGIPLDCPFISEEVELEWLSQADYVLAAQKSEAEYISSRLKPDGKTSVLVQPIVLKIRTGRKNSNPFRCLFVGTNILPNISGIGWFLEQVWPLVVEGNPQAELAIAGTVCGQIEGEHINTRLLGIVPSLEDEMDLAGVCLIPLLVGSGIKIKLLEALASGKACVSTPIGVQGVEDWADGAVEVAGTPEDFAAAILRLMFDDSLRAAREQAAHELIERHFSADSAPAREFAARVMEA